jgi:hypothetical protein
MADCIYPLFLIADVVDVVVIAARFPFTTSSWRAHHCVCAFELCVRGGLSLSSQTTIGFDGSITGGMQQQQ